MTARRPSGAISGISVKKAFRRTRIELILFLAVNLTVLRSDAADGTASAAASLLTPVSVESVFLGSVIMSEDTAGRVGIRLTGAGSFAPATVSPGRPAGTQPAAVNSTKPTTEKGMLSGEIITHVTMGAESGQGAVSVIVSYD